MANNVENESENSIKIATEQSTKTSVNHDDVFADSDTDLMWTPHLNDVKNIYFY